MIHRYSFFRYFFVLFNLVGINAQAAPEADYASIQTAYTVRDGAVYQTALSEAIQEIRRLTPDQCAEHQNDLLDTAQMQAFDGLEPLWLLLQDCAARAESPSVRAKLIDNASRFVREVRFDSSPAPQMLMAIARHNGLVVRSTRGDAVRAIITVAQQLRPDDLASLRLDDLLGRRSTRHALCQLDVRHNQYGQAALPDLIVQALCAHAGVSGGFGSVDEMCRQLLSETSPAAPLSLVVSATALMDSLLQTPGIDASDLDRLSGFCSNRIAGSGFAGGGADALDGHSTDACFGGRAEEIAEAGRLAQLIQDCLLTSSNDNPWAEGGGSEPSGDNSSTVKNDDGSTTSTTKNPDGSTTETTVYPNGHSVSTTTHTDGSVTTELQRPDGSSERVVMGADGKPESMQVVTVGADGSRTTKDYDGEGNLIRSEEIHHLGDVDDVVVTENGRTYQAIVPAGWIDEALDRIEKQKLNDQGKGGGYIINIWAKPPDANDPGSDVPGGGFDASNPACFELANMGFIDGEGGVLSSDDLWDYLFGREPGEPHPSTVYPTPDSIDEIDQEQLCGEFGISSVSGSHCRLPVLCTEGTELDENCQCKPIIEDNPGSLAGNGCASYYCADGTTPVPIGLNGCTCHNPESENGDTGPRLDPHPIRSPNSSFALTPPWQNPLFQSTVRW